ncbi:MAG: JAB domain-containing protein [Polyangiaceae bacterium]|nr:JAB domain-containing protein [Polyangiaceae bacterium]
MSKSCQGLTLHGAQSNDDLELLENMLSGSGSSSHRRAIARQLLEAYGSLSHVARQPACGLRKQLGCSAATAAKIAASFELGRRVVEEESRPSLTKALTAEAIAQWTMPTLGRLDYEEVWVLCLNSPLELQFRTRIGQGGLHGCALLARDVLVPVIRSSAAGFILIHNHPSGDPTPSREDIDLTQGLILAANAVCTPLLDHLIISRTGYVSLYENGHFPANK